MDKNEKKSRHPKGSELLENIRKNKKLFILYITLRTLVILVMIAQAMNHNYENVFLCALTLVLFCVPSLVELRLSIDIPDVLEAIIYLFIFSAEILGEINEYYLIFPNWDTILHTLNGFLAAAIGFSLVNLLNKSQRFTFQLSPLFLALVAFCFSMTIGVLWEFFEYFMDMSFQLDMQKDTVVHVIGSVMLNPNGANRPQVIQGINEVIVNGQELGLGGYLDIGLIDTMNDLLVNFVGAFIFSTIGYVSLRHKDKKNRIVENLVPTWKGEEEELKP